MNKQSIIISGDNDYTPYFFRTIPRHQLAVLPTPIQKLDRFSSALEGPNIFIKRDDLTGLATGGNKTRKLEFLIADALSKGANTIITAGGPQSNHCRQTAAACSNVGLECHLVYGGTKSDSICGNRFISQILGVIEHWTDKTNRKEYMESLHQKLLSDGKFPYIIPVGGSNSIGSAGYVLAYYELLEQIKSNNLNFDHIVFATSSGGTQAGLLVGKLLTNSNINLYPISIDQTKAIDKKIGTTFQEFVFQIALDFNQKFALNLNLNVDQFNLNTDYLGDGYGVVSKLEVEAIKLMAKTEGILMDPVYSGRALGGLIDLIKKGVFKKNHNILFWHTGGETALHAYIPEMLG
jgi:L-cysteate sulfo-lyase